FNQRIRCITIGGVIMTYAGTGQASYGGDGGPALQAQFRYPTSVAVACDGTVYVTDTYNHRIRHIRSGGTVATVAGSGQEAFSGDGGPGHQASVPHPRGLAIGPNNLIYTTTVSRVRRFGTHH
ncbi:Teneurin-2, partial [Streptomyces sp. NPDC005534]